MKLWSPACRPVLIFYADSITHADSRPTTIGDDFIVGVRHPLDLAARLRLSLRLQDAERGIDFARQQLTHQATEFDNVTDDFTRELMRTQDIAALTSERPYKRAFPVAEACEIIDDGAGSHFDERVVRAFHRVLPSVLEAKHRYADRPKVVTGAMAFAEYGCGEFGALA